jgi:hypothetical protein
MKWEYKISCDHCKTQGNAILHEDESGNAYWGKGKDWWELPKGFHMKKTKEPVYEEIYFIGYEIVETGPVCDICNNKVSYK